jgi:hypothetical protein
MTEPSQANSRHPVLSTLLRRFPAGLPATLRVEEAAALMRVSAGLLWKVIRLGEAPFPIWRLGRKITIPTAPLLTALGLDDPVSQDSGEPAELREVSG